MSQENVETVMPVIRAANVDVASRFRSNDAWAWLVEVLGPIFHPDFKMVAAGGPESELSASGLDGFRAWWLSWLAPWVTYRQEVEKAIDLKAVGMEA